MINASGFWKRENRLAGFQHCIVGECKADEKDTAQDIGVLARPEVGKDADSLVVKHRVF
jgi:hypothetical protein